MTSCGGAGSSSATFQTSPLRPRVSTRLEISAISSTWARLNTCPGLMIRRASPRRRLTSALRQAHRSRRGAGYPLQPPAPVPPPSSGPRPRSAPVHAPCVSASRSSRRPRRRRGRHKRRWSNSRRCAAAPARRRSRPRSAQAPPRPRRAAGSRRRSPRPSQAPARAPARPRRRRTEGLDAFAAQSAALRPSRGPARLDPGLAPNKPPGAIPRPKKKILTRVLR